MSLAIEYGGPTVHKTEQSNPTEIIVRLRKKHPRYTRDQIEERFLAEIAGDEDLVTPCLKYYFLNAWRGLEVRAKPNPVSSDKIALAAQRLRSVIISDLIMPNGKKIKDCTGTEMRTFGNFGIEVAQIVKRGVVSKFLDETELRALWKRTNGLR